MTDQERQIENTQRLLDLQRAIREHRINFLPEHESLVREVMALKIGPGQLLSEDQLSQNALAFVRTSAMALRFVNQRSPAPQLIGVNDAQVELFELFSELFVAITGRFYGDLASEVDVRDAVLEYMKTNYQAAAKLYDEVVERLHDFYQSHAAAIFGHARQLGGLKLVLGGQRTFGPSALGGVRKMALYVDTQLIPDPIYPFFEADLDLKAKHVELLKNLHRLLQLKPLVDARLPVPPVLVFPSFEKSLENHDVRTQVGINDLTLRVLRTTCNTSLESMEDLGKYLLGKPDEFIRAVMDAKLFVPPGCLPGELTDPKMAVERYMEEAKAQRSAASIGELDRLPTAALIATAVIERLAPQYHLLENGDELEAQPLLTQPIHWHFFESCARATAIELNRNDILSIEGLKTIRALQDQNFSWLANVPTPALVELLENQENLAFRNELAEHTKALFSAGVDGLDRVVREVDHGIASMLQRHQKTVVEIEQKYAPKYQSTWLVGGTSVALGAAALFMPALGALGMAAPLVTGAVMAGKLATDKVQESAEKRRMRHSLLGVLATTPRD